MNHETLHKLVFDYGAIIAGGYVRAWLKYGEPTEQGYADIDFFNVPLETRPEFSAKVKEIVPDKKADFAFFGSRINLYCNNFVFDGKSIFRGDALASEYSDEEILAQIQAGEAVGITQNFLASVDMNEAKIRRYLSSYDFTLHFPDKSLYDIAMCPLYFSDLYNLRNQPNLLSRSELIHLNHSLELAQKRAENKDQNPPSLVTMGRSFSASMKNWSQSGFKIASQDELEQRLQICEGCEFYTKALAGIGRCRKCGCFTKFKTKLSTENCPIGKW